MVDVDVVDGVTTSMYTTMAPTAIMTMMMTTVMMGVIALLTLVEGISSTTVRSSVFSQPQTYSRVLRNSLLGEEMGISLLSFEVLLT